MTDSNIAIAMAYYTAFGNKDLKGMTKYLHPNVELIGPLGGHQTGRDRVLAAAERSFPLFSTMTFRAQFGSANQAMLAYDMHFPEPIGMLRAASLLTIKDGLITRNELFFDAHPFKAEREK